MCTFFYFLDEASAFGCECEEHVPFVLLAYEACDELLVFYGADDFRCVGGCQPQGFGQFAGTEAGLFQQGAEQHAFVQRQAEALDESGLEACDGPLQVAYFA